MKTIKSYKFKLYNNQHRNARLVENIEIYSEVYNHCISLHNRFYKLYKKHLKKYALQEHLTKIKGRYKQRWKVLGSQAIQNITDRIENGYQLFFSNLKHKIKTSPPTFKGRHHYKSFTLKQAGYKLNQITNEVIINKNKYKYFNSRVFEGEIKTLTIKRSKKGEIFIVFSVKQEMIIKKGFETGKSAGFDFGLTTFLVDNEGNEIHSPLYLTATFDKLKSLHRKLSKKKKGSNHRHQAKIALNSLYEKISNQRDDWQWKMALKLVKANDAICLETLSFLQMQKDESLKTKKQKKNRAIKILDLSPGAFIKKVEYKAFEYGKKVVFIDKWFPSTKTCSECFYVMDKLPTEIRKWDCPLCGEHHDRDHNAAKNILREGSSSLGIDAVRPEDRCIDRLVSIV